MNRSEKARKQEVSEKVSETIVPYTVLYELSLVNTVGMQAYVSSHIFSHTYVNTVFGHTIHLFFREIDKISFTIHILDVIYKVPCIKLM